MSVTIPNWVPDGILASAEIPIIDDYRAALLRAFHETDSYYELWLCLCRVVNEMNFINPIVRTDATLKAILLDYQRGWKTLLLLHGIPRRMMSALILGTVAVEFHITRPRAARPDHYDGDGPGIYVAQISVTGRQGRGLSRLETQRLILLLEDYVEAFRDFERYSSSSSLPVSLNEKRRAQLARSIDSRFGMKPADVPRLQPRFISGKLGCRRVCELISMLRRRCEVDIGEGDEETWQVSLPSMIGCADNIRERVPAHHPDPASVCSMSHTTYTFGLVSCALMELDLSPEITTIPVLRIWDINQLPAAEMLVTLLASSLVIQDGYNVVQGGNKREKLVRSDDRQYVMAQCPYLCQNLEDTSRELRHRKQLLEAMDHAERNGFKAMSAELHSNLMLVDSQLRELGSLRSPSRQAIEDIKGRTAALQRDNLTRLEAINLIERTTQILKGKQ
ncbi:hypothetical protein F4803DRAFT_124895 [Xylaria telfairii]|nr:hypothetical protein F4803DRAFT_124895 [Xylaria telfairii]